MDPEHVDAGPSPLYVGQSWFLHYWPWASVGAGLIPLSFGSWGALFLFFVPAMMLAALLPWRFAVFGTGIVLWFAFGRRCFLRKDDVTVRANPGGAMVLPKGRLRFGYPLTDGIVERRRATLRAVFEEHGFRVDA
jgi:hypothetical protein